MLDDVNGWTGELERLHARIAPFFRRMEPRQRALRYLKGLLDTARRQEAGVPDHLALQAGATAASIFAGGGLQ